MHIVRSRAAAWSISAAVARNRLPSAATSSGSPGTGSAAANGKATARQRLATGRGELDLGLDTAAAGGPLPITASRMGCLADALEHAYRVLGFDEASGGDEVFGELVLARISEPASKLDILVKPVHVIVPTFG